MMVAAWVRRMNLAKLREREEVIRLFIRTVFATYSRWRGSEMTQVARTARQALGPPLLSFLSHLSNRQAMFE